MKIQADKLITIGYKEKPFGNKVRLFYKLIDGKRFRIALIKNNGDIRTLSLEVDDFHVAKENMLLIIEAEIKGISFIYVQVDSFGNLYIDENNNNYPLVETEESLIGFDDKFIYYYNKQTEFKTKLKHFYTGYKSVVTKKEIRKKMFIIDGIYVNPTKGVVVPRVIPIETRDRNVIHLCREKSMVIYKNDNKVGVIKGTQQIIWANALDGELYLLNQDGKTATIEVSVDSYLKNSTRIDGVSING